MLKEYTKKMTKKGICPFCRQNIVKERIEDDCPICGNYSRNLLVPKNKTTKYVTKCYTGKKEAVTA